MEDKEKIRKKRILDAALTLVKEKGIENTSMREIAAKAGLTTGAIYYSYKNKDALFQDIVDESIHFASRIFTDYQTSGKSRDELLPEIRNEIALRLSRKDEQLLHLTLLLSMISEQKEDKNKEKLEENYRRIIKNTGDLFASAFDIADQKGKYIAAAFLTAAIDGMAILTALDVYPESEEKMIDSFLEFFAIAIPAYLRQQKESE